jgi:hypothetical protein
VTAGSDPQLDDPPGSGEYHQQDADHGGQQERDAQRRLSEALPAYAAPDQDVCGVDM